jgi:hypothetical protein
MAFWERKRIAVLVASIVAIAGMVGCVQLADPTGLLSLFAGQQADDDSSIGDSNSEGDSSEGGGVSNHEGDSEDDFDSDDDGGASDDDGDDDSEDDNDDGDDDDGVSSDPNSAGNVGGGDPNTPGDTGGGTVGDPAAGQTFYNANNCTACHGATGSGPPNIRGASASNLFDRLSGVRSHPGGTVSGVTQADAENLAAFLSQ